jgi:ribosome biogenesis protein Nip4
MIAHALKLNLGLLFRISNILSLGWGNGRTHLSEKGKMKKNVDDHGSTPKNRKKK